MISETRMAQGSRVERQGKLRPDSREIPEDFLAKVAR